MKNQTIHFDNIFTTIFGLTTLGALYLASLYSYLLFHSLAELYCIAIALGIFMFAWNTRRLLDNDFLLFLGIAYLFIGLLDLAHTLSYEGMNIFPGHGTNLPTQLWIATRYLESFTLLVAFIYLKHRLRLTACYLAYSLACILILLSIFYWHNFPDCYIAGQGLTIFKRASEYIISIILVLALARLYQQRANFAKGVLLPMALSIILTIASEMTFTAYVNVYGTLNLAGHYLKILSYYCIYRAIISTGLTKPYELLFRNIKQHERELSTARDQLESRVRQRTRELEAVNQQLRQEILAKEQAQIELQKSEERFRSLFEGAPDAIFLSDPHTGIILDANSAACRLMLMQREELVGQPQGQLHPHSQENTPTPPPVNATLANRAIRRADGTLVPVEIMSQLLTIHNKPVIQSIFRDISEAQKLENRLRQVQKMEAIGTLAGGIAHDFNNILTPILGYAGIVLDNLPEGSEDKICQQEIVNAGQRAKDLVRQILTFSRQAQQQLVPIQPYFIVKEVLKLLRSSIPSTIEIREQLASFPELVLADPTQLHQVIMNLCTNAYQAMRETGGVLTISLSVVDIESPKESGLGPSRHMLLSVSDTGPGMNKEVMERIFEPYFTTKSNEGGTGLGLSVVHGIVDSLDGQINARSKPGKGATFEVILPLIEADAMKMEITTPEVIVGGTERILVVDDEEVIVKMEQHMLENMGYQVTSTQSGDKALELFAWDPSAFDLVLTDMTMPKMTGAQLALELIKIRPDIPIILCTGFSEIINEKKAQSLGIRRLLLKPIIRQELDRLIREVLSEKVVNTAEQLNETSPPEQPDETPD